MSVTLSTIKLASPLIATIAKSIQVAAILSDVKLDVKDLSVSDVVKISPYNILPVVTTECGNYSGIAAIKSIVKPCSSLGGRCPYQKQQIDQYLQVVPLIIEQSVAFRALEDSKSTDNDKINALNKLVQLIKPLNDVLVNSTFLLGNTFTIADIVVAASLKDTFARYMGPKRRTELSALTRWFNTVFGQKAFLKVFGAEIAIQDKDVYLMPDLTAAPKAAEVKKEDPIAKMPKSPMHLDTIKKLYCLARPFNPDFAKDFWPQFDAAGYECFQVDFKYPEDFPVEKKLFMAENGINGFITRGEQAKKHVFVVLNIFEKDGFFNVRGAAIIRGSREVNGDKEIPYALADVSDAEEYTFTPIDVSNDEGKAKFIKLFCPVDWEGAEILNRIHLK